MQNNLPSVAGSFPLPFAKSQADIENTKLVFTASLEAVLSCIQAIHFVGDPPYTIGHQRGGVDQFDLVDRAEADAEHSKIWIHLHWQC